MVRGHDGLRAVPVFPGRNVRPEDYGLSDALLGNHRHDSSVQPHRGLDRVPGVLIGGNLHTDYLYGILILFLAVIGSTGYTAICKKLANKGYNALSIVTWQFILAIGYFLIPFLVFDAATWTPAYLAWPVLKPIIMLAVLCSGVAFVIYAACVDRIGMTRTTVFLPLVAIVSAVAALILGQDTLHPLQMAGILIAMAGVVMAQYTSQKRKTE